MPSDSSWYSYLEHGWVVECECGTILEEGSESRYCEWCELDDEEED